MLVDVEFLTSFSILYFIYKSYYKKNPKVYFVFQYYHKLNIFLKKIRKLDVLLIVYIVIYFEKPLSELK